jgi:acetone carboxylase alpha subunit
MGNIEVWEQSMPMVYIGRSIVANSGGAGKYRGGCSFVSTWVINKTDHLRLVTSEHSSRVFDNGGLCGGYPAPTCQKHHAVRDSNIHELTEKRAPLAHAPGTNPHRSDLELRFGGEHVTVEGPYITAPHKEGDIFSHSYNGGGGYGDVLERDPLKTAMDVENGFLTTQAAHDVFGIVLNEDEDGYPRADLEATGRRRAEMREDRLAKAVPVSEWIARERRRVEKADFAPEVRKMYASAMKLSQRFTKDFSDFWNVDGKSAFSVE